MGWVTEESRFDYSAEARDFSSFFYRIPTGCAAHPAPYTMGTAGLFL
jgi:hypothetical protein